MKISEEWLKKNNACSDGVKWFLDQEETDAAKVALKLLKAGNFDWSNWLLTHVMTHRQKIQYAVFSAEQVIEIYEKKYPEDQRPRKAIEAVKAVLDHDTEETRTAAGAA